MWASTHLSAFVRILARIVVVIVVVATPCAREWVMELANGMAIAAASMTNVARDKASFDLRNPFIRGSPHEKYQITKSPKKEHPD